MTPCSAGEMNDAILADFDPETAKVMDSIYAGNAPTPRLAQANRITATKDILISNATIARKGCPQRQGIQP